MWERSRAVKRAHEEDTGEEYGGPVVRAKWTRMGGDGDKVWFHRSIAGLPGSIDPGLATATETKPRMRRPSWCRASWPSPTACPPSSRACRWPRPRKRSSASRRPPSRQRLQHRVQYRLQCRPPHHRSPRCRRGNQAAPRLHYDAPARLQERAGEEASTYAQEAGLPPRHVLHLHVCVERPLLHTLELTATAHPNRSLKLLHLVPQIYLQGLRAQGLQRFGGVVEMLGCSSSCAQCNTDYEKTSERAVSNSVVRYRHAASGSTRHQLQTTISNHLTMND